MTLKSLLLALGLVTTASSQALELEYAGFYNYLKDSQHVEYNLVRPAFYLNEMQSKKPCATKQAQIKAGSKRYPLLMNQQSGEFFVPYDKRIKDIRGTLWFDLPETCQMQVAVIGKIAGQALNTERVSKTALQIYALMSDYAGMVKFMMPDWQGVVFHGAQGQTHRVARERLQGETIELPWPATHMRLQMQAN